MTVAVWLSYICMLFASGGSRTLERGVLLFAGPLPKAVQLYNSFPALHITFFIEVRSDYQSVRSAEKKFSPLFSVIRMGSRGTFMLCIASSRCKRIAGPGAAMCFHFLLKFRSCNVIRIYVRNLQLTRKYTCSWSRSQAVRFQPGVAM